MKPKSKKLLKHSFWNGSRLPVAIAHRGGDGAGVKKENTVAAFKAAWDLGYEYGETDSVVTSDGLVIAIHGAGNIFDSVINRRIQRKRLQKMTLK
ncbi:MAG: glycerophosphodiester phosphodiesterase, partial [Candidatus Saccharibacteria bacterium]|nr:glycerophosphodiester phosphodiesterase [Candidatus Saccharibacteria bacterium]